MTDGPTNRQNNLKTDIKALREVDNNRVYLIDSLLWRLSSLALSCWIKPVSYLKGCGSLFCTNLRVWLFPWPVPARTQDTQVSFLVQFSSLMDLPKSLALLLDQQEGLALSCWLPKGLTLSCWTYLRVLLYPLGPTRGSGSFLLDLPEGLALSCCQVRFLEPLLVTFVRAKTDLNKK